MHIRWRGSCREEDILDRTVTREIENLLIETIEKPGQRCDDKNIPMMACK